MAENVGTTETKCYLVKLEDGYHIENLDGTISDVCAISKDGAWVALGENPANRKWLAVKKAEEGTVDGAKIPLTYKETRTLGPRAAKVPNENLVKTYLSEDEQNEYFAIIARAQAAYDADHPAKEKTAAANTKDKTTAKVTKGIEQLIALGMSKEEIIALIG